MGEKRVIHYTQSILSFDWFFIFFYIILGITGIRITFDLSSWKFLIEKDFQSVLLGKVTPVAGVTRYLTPKTTTWQDILQPHPIYPLDKITTHENSKANLSLIDQVTIQILESSSIIPHLEAKNLDREQQYNFFKLPFLSLPKPSYSIELGVGKYEVQFKDEKQFIHLIINHLPITILSTHPDTKIKILVQPPIETSVLKIFPLNSSIKLFIKGKTKPITLEAKEEWTINFSQPNLDISVNLLGTSPDDHLSNMNVNPITPRLLSPTSKALFISNSNEQQEVILRWQTLPRYLQPQLEIRKFDNPDFSTKPELSPSGAILHMPDGHYLWRVRTYNAKNQFSEWSPLREFSVQENTRDSPTIVVSETEETERIINQARFQKESELARQKEIQKEKDNNRKRIEFEAKLEKNQAIHRRLILRERHLDKVMHQKILKTKFQNIAKASRGRIIQEIQLQQGVVYPHPITLRHLVDSSIVHFEWNDIPHIKSYNFILFKGHQQIQTIATLKPETDLPLQIFSDAKAEYEFEIETILTNNKSIKSSKFAISIAPPIPELLSPSEGIALKNIEMINFTWSSLYPLDGYIFQLSSNFDFSHILFETTLHTTKLTIPIPQIYRPYKKYFWRIRGWLNTKDHFDPISKDFSYRRWPSDWTYPHYFIFE